MSAGNGTSYRSRASLWLCLLSAAFIVYGTTIPFHFVTNRGFVLAKLHRLTFNPLFPTTSGQHVSIPDTAQNILLFVPFGIFGAAALDGAKSSGRRVLAVVAAGAALSTTVETLQLMDLGRTASFADIVFNTCGAAIGAFASTAVLDGMARFIRRLKGLGALDAPAFFPLAVGVVLVSLATWQPFDVTLDLGVGWSKVTALGHDPWQAGGPANEALQMLRFLVLTLLAASWLRDLGVRRFTAIAIAACALLAAALELTQMLIASRIPGLADVSINVAGAMAGGLLFRPLQRVPSSLVWLALLVAATWLAAIIPALSPYQLSVVYRPFWTMSLGYARFNWVAVIGHISELLLMCFPLGFAASWVVRRTSRVYLAAIAVTVVLQFLLAGLERWVGTGNPNIADVVVGALGSLGGAWTGRAGWLWFQDRVHALERPLRPAVKTSHRSEEILRAAR